MAGWSDEAGLLRQEIIQRRDEGCRVPQWIVDAVEALPPGTDGWSNVISDPLWRALEQLSDDAALSAREPNDLAAIRRLRPDGPRDLGWQPTAAELQDRLHGAWLGRCVGCALGKPVENGVLGMAVADGAAVGRHRIRRYLEAREEWPLTDYFSINSALPDVKVTCDRSTREHIAYMEPDDDIHYTLVGLGVLEKHGPEFQWYQVAEYWSAKLPYLAICTAERQGILNFWNCVAGAGHQGRGIPSPAFTRRYKNPYREWIGAQIRADGWAWACAGKPELAAEFAYRDACWTHTRNGIYGEMFFAAIQAAAFVEHDPRRLLAIGLSEIPAQCRLAQWVQRAMEWAAEAPDMWAALERMDSHDELRLMSPIHTINNAVVCALALLRAKPQIDDAACSVVMAGLDTDCNGATVGSVVGAMSGHAQANSALGQRLNDTIQPLVFGFAESRMQDLAERHARVWHKVDEWYRQAQD